MTPGTHRGIRHRIGLMAALCCADGLPASAVRQPDAARRVPPRTDLADTPFRLTRQAPAEVRKVCRMARAQTRVPFTCPPLVPDVPIVGTNPKGPALSGIYRIDSKGYVLTFNNGENPGTLHWIVGKGRPDTLKTWLLDDRYNVVKGKPVLVSTSRISGRRVRLYRFPANPAGGLLGGHLAAFTEHGGYDVVASVHGTDRTSQRAGIKMVLAMSK